MGDDIVRNIGDANSALFPIVAITSGLRPWDTASRPIVAIHGAYVISEIESPRRGLIIAEQG
jgi:hypothetical protein